MNYPHFLFSVTALLTMPGAGCKEDRSNQPTTDAKEVAKQTAIRDLKCDAVQARLNEYSEYDRTEAVRADIVVTGCGHRAEYDCRRKAVEEWKCSRR